MWESGVCTKKCRNLGCLGFFGITENVRVVHCYHCQWALNSDPVGSFVKQYVEEGGAICFPVVAMRVILRLCDQVFFVWLVSRFRSIFV